LVEECRGRYGDGGRTERERDECTSDIGQANTGGMEYQQGEGRSLDRLCKTK